MRRGALGAAVALVAAAWIFVALLPQTLGQEGDDISACLAPGSTDDLVQKALCLGGVALLVLGWRSRNIWLALGALAPLAAWIPIATC
jgi:hypothetical protein